MNALYLGALRLLETAYGPVDWDHREVTDVWAGPDRADDMLNFLGSSVFVKREQDRISAHLTTANGRVFLHRIDTSPWSPMRGNKNDSLLMLDRLAGLLGVRALYYSPVSRGLSMIDFAREKHPEWFSRDLPLNWDNRDTAIVPNFTRKQSDWSIVGKWLLHKFDVRAAYLAVARTVPVGFGETRRIRQFEPKTPAIWPVSFPNTAKRNEKQARYQYPVNPAPIMAPGWYPTEIVRAALAHGQALEIGPGQGWTGTTTALRPFCEKLTRARANADGEGRNERERRWLVDSIKLVYTQSFGALQSYRKSRERLYQPHWRYSILAESARRMWALYDSCPHYIIGMETDAVYAIAPPEVPPAEIVPKASPDAFNPGTIRYEGCTPITRELYDLFGQKGHNVREYLERRNCLEPWETGE